MNQDPNPQEGDLAVVYSNQQSNLTENAVFSKIILPETVVLDTVVEDYIEIGFQPVDESIEMDCWGNLDSNMMNVDIYMMSEETNYRISYESQDGLTYTRGNDTPDEIDLGFDVKFGNRWGEARWDDRIGQFFIIGQANFNGLYQYNKYNTENLAVYNLSEAYIENNKLNIPILNRSLNKQNLITLLEYIYQLNDNIRFNTTVTMDEDNNIYVYYTSDDLTVQWGSASAWILQIYYDLSTHIGYLPTINNKGQNIDPVYIKKYKFNSQTNVINEEIYNSEYIASIGINIQSLITEPYILFGGCIAWYNGETKETNIEFNSGIQIMACNSLEEGVRKDLDDCWYNTTPRYKALKYISAPTQLTTEAKDVYRGQFYGGNGVEEGLLGIPDNSFLDVPAEVFVNIWDNYNKMNPIVITDDNRMDFINKNSEILLIPTKYDGTPLIDTSNLTNANILFHNFRKLKYIPQLDFSSATTGHSIFSGCINLESVMIANTNEITDLSEMFNGCTNLRNILLFDTSNVTNFGSMFQNCSSLVTAPQFNTSSASIISYMFNLCTNLINVPFFDLSGISNANYLKNMFSSCPNLSNESLNNILASLASTLISGTDGKTLKNVGLSQEQAQICETLSNYTAFTAAGWTTGY